MAQTLNIILNPNSLNVDVVSKTQQTTVEVVITGGLVGVDKSFVFPQSSASDTWEITHNLTKFPSVSVVDSAGSKVIGEVTYNSINKVTLTFSAAFSGNAYLN